MPANPIVVTDQDTTRPYAFLGMQVRLLVSSINTGSYEIFEVAGPAGSGFPLHRHSWAETFYLLRGEVEFGLGKDITWGTAGTVIHFPPSMAHSYQIGQAGATMLCVTSNPGAGRLFAALDRELPSSDLGMDKLIEISARYGTFVVG